MPVSTPAGPRAGRDQLSSWRLPAGRRTTIHRRPQGRSARRRRLPKRERLTEKASARPCVTGSRRYYLLDLDRRCAHESCTPVYGWVSCTSATGRGSAAPGRARSSWPEMIIGPPPDSLSFAPSRSWSVASRVAGRSCDRSIPQVTRRRPVLHSSPTAVIVCTTQAGSHPALPLAEQKLRPGAASPAVSPASVGADTGHAVVLGADLRVGDGLPQTLRRGAD